ncbi:MAG: orotidine-5'-phosphate decarboxylase [Streptococcaceae bacterium]|jgi:orotidine-5'-phosphate decarboxylase|nr:orotidine-5'-phosphate decarboxylase [Streptococcaceae bacterium]
MFEKRPVIALDFSSIEEVTSFLDKFPKEESLYCKIGMELFYQEGIEVVKLVKSYGHAVFLDLKLHDIPNTVKSAMRGIAKMGVDMVNVHAAGGVEMMQEALIGLQEGTRAGGVRPKLIAVTQLTSTSEEAMHTDQLIPVSITDSVVHYAKCTNLAGLDGVVSSAKEVALIKEATHKDFICLTPGIRPKGGEVGDQKRVMTPSEARKIGSDYIVVGRPITQAENPVVAYQKIKEDWSNA